MNNELLRHLRQIAEYTQEEMALKVGCDRSLISKIEANVIPLQPHTEQKILKALGDAGISGAEIALLHTVFASRKMKTVKKDR